MLLRAEQTTAPVSHSGETDNIIPEFARLREIERYWGLKRGTVYNLLATGKIRGVLLRARGKKSGVRLIDCSSVRKYIQEQMAIQESEQKAVVE